tara:strand:- start:225 stop:464 length:240 start_codon:yes stop_codon:yes gene_type:complete
MKIAVNAIRVEQILLTGKLLFPIRIRNRGAKRKPMEPPLANNDFAVSDAPKYRMETSRHVEVKLASTMPLQVLRQRSNF